VNRDAFTRLEVELRRFLGGGMGRDGEMIVEADLLVLQRVEGEVKRHHLRQRRRIGHRVGIVLAQNVARFGVNHDGGGDGSRPVSGGQGATLDTNGSAAERENESRKCQKTD
jgi:hypothetical protein